MQTNRAALRRALIAERLKTPGSSPAQPPVGPCFVCGVSFVQTESRFCSDRCRDSFDAGARPFERVTSKDHMERFPVSAMILGQGAKGAIIQCLGCKKRFESLSLRYCSKECRFSADNRGSMGPVAEGFDDPRRVCAAEGCDKKIPRWTNGRATSKRVRFCSARCKRAAKRAEAPLEPKSSFDPKLHQKTPDFIGSFDPLSEGSA